MIKILKQGVVKEYIATCNVCGCVFSFQDMDIREIVVFRDTDFSSVKNQRVVSCPYCNKYVMQWSEMGENDKKHSPVPPEAMHNEPICGY